MNTSASPTQAGHRGLQPWIAAMHQEFCTAGICNVCGTIPLVQGPCILIGCGYLQDVQHRDPTPVKIQRKP